MNADRTASIVERIARRGREMPDAAALSCGGASLTHGELAALLFRCANVVLGAGKLQRNECVGLLMDPVLQWPACHLGVVAAGGCVVPISTMLRPDAIARILQDADVAILIATAAQRGLAEAALRTMAPARAPRLRIGVDFEAEGWTSLHALLTDASHEPRIAPRADDDPVEIIYSSGTTGVPKGIVQGHRARTQAYLTYASMQMDASAAALCCTPPYSNPALGLTLGMLGAGGRVVLLQKFEPREFLRLAASERITHTFLVPTQLLRLLDEPSLREFAPDSLRVTLVGGAPLHRNAKRAALERWPGTLIETYGMTEGGPAAVHVIGAAPDKLGSVGRPPPGVDVRIVDGAGREAKAGETGEIVGRSPFMMLRYHGGKSLPESAVWRDAADRVFLRSGDLGRLDDEGYLYVVGRIKDVIISGGFNVYPADLEAELAQHPAVADCAVAGVASRRWGETPCAWIELRPGFDSRPEAIREWVNARLGRHQRIGELHIVATLPRNASGKVLRSQLIARRGEEQSAECRA